MAWFIGQSALMLVFAFLVGLLVGWLIWHRRESRPDAEIVAPSAVESAATPPAAAASAAAEPVDAAPAAAEPVDAGPAAVEAAAASTPDAETAEPVPALAVEPEDLARVEGIGPKIAAALVNAGIRTYRELADADLPDIEAAINAAGITFAPSIVTWSQQAKLLADGDEDGFIALTDRLIAGRDVSAKATTAPDSEPAGPAGATDATALDSADPADATAESADEPERKDSARRAAGGRRAASRHARVRQP